MRKIPALCLALAAFFYASAAYSRICFLGDLDCQLGRFEAAEGVPCAEQGGDWVYEYDRCSQLVYGAPVCNDSTGNYYAPGTCPTGYTDMYSLSNQDKYICTSSTFGESCGVKCCKGSSATDEEGDIMCEADYVVCSNNSVGVGDSCTDKDGTKYKECICESTQYPYTCSETGLTANNSYDSCMDSSGNLYYAQCQCASGYTLTDTLTCENNCACDGTIIRPAPELPGTKQYCWQGCRCNDDCEVNQCLIDFQSDFDTYWGGYDVNTKCNNLTIDCATLGYNSGRAGTGTTCKDGTEPYRCPFDHTQVYCESGLESSCEFTEKAECETAYFNSVCSIDGAGCYNPTACRTGYGKTVEVCSAGDAGNWSLGSTDEYGCARCLCETTCIDKVTPPANAEPVYEPCSACGSSTQIIIDFTCPTGYVKSSDGTSCEKSCGEEYSLPSCPSYANCSECDGKYKMDSHKTPSLELEYYGVSGGYSCWPAGWGESSIEIVVNDPNGKGAVIVCSESGGGDGYTDPGFAAEDKGWILRSITTSQGTCIVNAEISNNDNNKSITLNTGNRECMLNPDGNFIYFFSVYENY